MIGRVIQKFAALLGIILLAPILLIVAVIILIFNGRPVLFAQERVGLHGKAFYVYKFRSMTVKSGSEKGAFDIGSNKRVTKIGAILRKTKIDELPQLVNVIKGDMLIVGPRPEIRKWVDIYPERWKIVHSIPPGITDPASIYYRDEEKILSQADNPERAYLEEVLPHKLDLYEEYISNRSGLYDLKIVLKTVIATLH